MTLEGEKGGFPIMIRLISLIGRLIFKKEKD
jgi:hypothetical protein